MRQSPSPQSPSIYDRAAPALRIGAIALLIGWVAAKLWLHYLAGHGFMLNKIFGIDFQVFYYAAAARAQGLDPYDLVQLSSITPHAAGLPFVYPPFWLILFQPLLLLPFQQAVLAWLAIKLAILPLGWRGWRIAFGDALPLGWLMLFSIGAFGSALAYDLASGNVTVFEFVLLGWACAFFTQRRWRASAFAVAAAGAAKLLPLLFLAVPVLLRRDRRSLAAVGLVGASVAAVLALDAALQPEEFRRWLQSLHHVYWFGSSIYSFVLTLLQNYSPSAEALIGWRVPHAIYGAIAAAIIAATFVALRRKPPMRLALALACLAVFLCFPRLWIYSFLLATPAATVAIVAAVRQGGALRWAGVALGLVLLGVRESPPDIFPELYGRFVELYALIAVWGLALMLCWRATPAPDQAAAA